MILDVVTFCGCRVSEDDDSSDDAVFTVSRGTCLRMLLFCCPDSDGSVCLAVQFLSQQVLQLTTDVPYCNDCLLPYSVTMAWSLVDSCESCTHDCCFFARFCLT